MPPKLLAGAENASLRRRLARDGRAGQGEPGDAPLSDAFHAAQYAMWTQQVMDAITVAPLEAGRETRAPVDPPPAHAAVHAA